MAFFSRRTPKKHIDEEEIKIKRIHEILDEELDLEEEGRRIFVANVLWRAEKYALGFLRGYRVEKYEDFTKNPAWILIKVYWTKDQKPQLEEIMRDLGLSGEGQEVPQVNADNDVGEEVQEEGQEEEVGEESY